jgi:hypothetical protein
VPRKSGKKTATPRLRSRSRSNATSPAPIDVQEEEAALARVARYVGEDAERPLQTYADLRFLHGLYRQGNPRALLYCVILCAQEKANLPRWALGALAKIFKCHLLEGKRIESQLNRGERGGRTAKPAAYAVQRQIERRVFDAVNVARFNGFRGRKAFKEAQRRLAEEKLSYSINTIQDLYYAARRRPVESAAFLRDLERRIGVPPAETSPRGES